jgi:hypothetical protein
MNSLGMKNVSDKCCTENQNTYFKGNKFCLKIVPFIRKCAKILLGPAGHR